MGTEQRSEIRFFREEPRVCLGLLQWELGGRMWGAKECAGVPGSAWLSEVGVWW